MAGIPDLFLKSIPIPDLFPNIFVIPDLLFLRFISIPDLFIPNLSGHLEETMPGSHWRDLRARRSPPGGPGGRRTTREGLLKQLGSIDSGFHPSHCQSCIFPDGHYGWKWLSIQCFNTTIVGWITGRGLTSWPMFQNLSLNLWHTSWRVERRNEAGFSS